MLRRKEITDFDEEEMKWKGVPDWIRFPDPNDSHRKFFYAPRADKIMWEDPSTLGAPAEGSVESFDGRKHSHKRFASLANLAQAPLSQTIRSLF